MTASRPDPSCQSADDGFTVDAQADALDDWLSTPPGRYMLAWEQSWLDRSVVDLFGFHALQLGLPRLDALQANRMPHRWLASDRLHERLQGRAAPSPPPAGNKETWGGSAFPCEPPPSPRQVALRCDFDALPFPNQSIDLVVLPHALELARDPHLTLAEVERVLVPEGRLAILGFNPASLWGWRQRAGRLRRRLGSRRPLYLPQDGGFIHHRRLRDWLRLLNFELEGGRFGCYRPPLTSERWLDRFGWMDTVGDRWWPVLGSVYCLLAVKRVRGMRLVGLVRDEVRIKAVTAPPRTVATHHHQHAEANAVCDIE